MRRSYAIMMLVAGFAGSNGAAAQPARTVADCAALAQLASGRPDDATALIETAAIVERRLAPADGRRSRSPATGPAPMLPRHCEIFGKMQERAGANGQTYAIRFHMRLPAAWNGRSFFQGGSRSNGVVGTGTDQVAFFAALVAWTEQGKAPDSFVSTAGRGTNWPGRRRLFCAYPKVA
ncbi:hypothetical protein GCM10022268_20760 [Sphingomonas cynarae]|uniref:Tannase/feruloyl esterase family alpha/beta hydrolase n=1 Tax=Sphingomonas cynarae TaxID=930197 RepID=A0ABP7DY13_9SPHN